MDYKCPGTDSSGKKNAHSTYTVREEHSSRGVNSLNKGMIGDSRGAHATSPHFVKLIKFYENILPFLIFVSTWRNALGTVIPMSMLSEVLLLSLYLTFPCLGVPH